MAPNACTKNTIVDDGKSSTKCRLRDYLQVCRYDHNEWVSCVPSVMCVKDETYWCDAICLYCLCKEELLSLLFIARMLI